MIQPQPAVSKPRINSAFKQLMSVHWWMAACYLILFTGGWFMSQLPKGVAFRGSLYDFHKSIGVLTIGLLTWRILVLLQVWQRKYTKRFPKFTPEWIRVAALHTALYGFMWAAPVTGIYLSNSYKPNNVKFFGVVLPDVFPQNSAAADLGGDLHFWFAYTFLALVLMHMLVQWKAVRANWRRFINFVDARFARRSMS